MTTINIVQLFAAMEAQVGKEALHSAFASYSGEEAPSTPKKAAAVPIPGAPVKARKPQSEETKAKAAEKRAATKAAKAIAEAGESTGTLVADDEPVAPVAAAAAVAAEKPKKVLTDEQKAKMKAGREAAAAKKAAAATAPATAPAAAAATATAEAEATDGNASDTSSQKRRGPKKLSEMSAEELAAHKAKVAERKEKKVVPPLPASPAPVAEEEGHTVFAEFPFKGVSYLRNKRGDILNQEYEWVGRYDSAKKLIDTKFPKPSDLEEE
jgi:hypothetical protein